MTSRGELQAKVKSDIDSLSLKLLKEYGSESHDVRAMQLMHAALVDKFVSYDLACKLWWVRKKEDWKRPEWCLRNPSYRSFYNWAYVELGYTERRLRYWLTAVERMEELNFTRDDIKLFLAIGWPKLTRLMSSKRVTSLTEASRYIKVLIGAEEEDVARIMKLAESSTLEEADASVNKGEILDGKLAETITEKLHFHDKTSYTLYVQAKQRFEKRVGRVVSATEVVKSICAHYLSSVLPGESGIEIPTEIDVKVSAFAKMIEEAYDVKLQILVVVPEAVEDEGAKNIS